MSIVFKVPFKVSVLTFCPEDSCIGVGGVLKLPIIVRFVLICVSNSIRMLFMKLSTPEFGACMFSTVTFS